MFISILYIWSIFLPFLLGFAIISVLSIGKKLFTLSQKLSLSFFIGSSIFSMSLFLLSIFNFKWDRVWISVLFSLISAILLFIYYLKGLKKKLTMPKIGKTVLGGFVSYLLFALIIFKLFSIFFLALDKPVINFDAWANWSLRSKAFYFEKGIPQDKDSQYFLGGGGRINYPLQVPIFEAWIYNAIGSWDDRFVKIIFPLYLLFFLIFFYSFIYQPIGSTKALIFSFIFISIPLISYHASADYADLPVGLYIGIATMILYLYLTKEDKRYLLLSSLMFGFSGWIKNEGVFLFLITILVLVTTLIYQKKIKWSIFLSSIFGVIFLLPWLIFKSKLGLGMSNLDPAQELIGNLSIHFEVIPNILKNLLSLSNFSLLWLVVIIGVLFYQQQIKQSKLGIFITLIFCYFLGFIFIYLFTDNYIYLLDGTIGQRNLLTIAPFIFWVMALII